MERLTERDDKGNLLFNGKQVYAGDFYEAVSCLEEYEDTDLTPEQIRELKERDTAKIVNLIPFDGCDDDSDITYKAYCPICKRYIGILFKKGYKGKGDNFCRNCGQRLKWED